MKKTKSRILSLLLVFAMLASLLSTAAFATEETPSTSEPGVVENVDVPQPPAGDENADNENADNENADTTLPQPPAGDEGAENDDALLGGTLAIPNAALLSVALDDVYVSDASGNDTTGSGEQNLPVKTLAKAYDLVAENGTIHVVNDMTLTAGLNLDANKTVTILSDSNGDLGDAEVFTITRGSAFAAPMLTVSAGEVTLSNIVFDGNKVEVTASGTSTGILVSGGTLTMNANSVLQNSKNPRGEFSTGGVKVTGGAFTLAGGTITGNVGYDGAGVLLRGGTFTMTDGRISKNIASGFCGGVYSFGGTSTPVTATITGGVIEGNFVSNGTSGGGGVMIHNYSTAIIGGTAKIINNGIANSNTAAAAGVWLYGTASCTLTVGENAQIVGNTIGATVNGTGTDMTINPGTNTKECNVLLKGNQTVAVDDSTHLTGTAKIGVYTETAPAPPASNAGDVKIAINAAAGDAQYFFSDNAAAAGILFCDGTDDYIGGVKMGTPSAGHTHAADTLWLSVAAKAMDEVYVKTGADEATATGEKDRPLPTLEAGLRKVAKNGTVYLLSNVEWAIAYNFVQGKPLTITSADNAIHTISVKYTLASSLFHLATPGDHLKLTNVTVDGTGRTGGVYGEFFVDTGATLELGDKATLQNFAPRAVNVRASGTLIMTEGSAIKGCTAGVNNTFGGYKGTDYAGAAVYVCPGGTFDMRGGTISGNFAAAGGGVFGENGAIFKISGNSEVKDNKLTNTPDAQISNVRLGYYNNASQIIDLTGGLGVNSSIGVNTVATPTENLDVQIAKAAANAGDAQYFSSDNVTAAGILFCDGTNDWKNGEQMTTNSVGHIHTGNANTLWLSVAARLPAPVVTGTTAKSITIKPDGAQAYSIDGNDWYRVKDGKLQKLTGESWTDVSESDATAAGLKVTLSGNLTFTKNHAGDLEKQGTGNDTLVLRNKWQNSANPVTTNNLKTSMVSAEDIAKEFDPNKCTDNSPSDDQITGDEAGKVEVTIDPDTGRYVVTVKTNITGTVEIPDTWGEVELDLGGNKITGDDGAPGAPGLKFTTSAPTKGPGTSLNITGPGEIKGGAGTSGGGEGGAGIGVTGDPDSKVTITGVTVTGGAGGAGSSGAGGDGGEGIDGGIEVTVNPGTTVTGGAGGNGGTDGAGGKGGGGIKTPNPVTVTGGTVKGGTGGSGAGDQGGGEGGGGITGTTGPITVTGGSVEGGEGGDGSGSGKGGAGGGGITGGTGTITVDPSGTTSITGGTGGAGGNTGSGGKGGGGVTGGGEISIEPGTGTPPSITGGNGGSAGDGGDGTGGEGGGGITGTTGPITVTGGSVEGGEGGDGSGSGKGGAGGGGITGGTGTITVDPSGTTSITGGTGGTGGTNGTGTGGEGGEGGGGITGGGSITVNPGTGTTPSIGGGKGGSGGSGSGGGGKGGPGGNVIDPTGTGTITVGGGDLKGGEGGAGGAGTGTDTDGGEGGGGGNVIDPTGTGSIIITGGGLTGGTGGKGGGTSTGTGGTGGTGGNVIDPGSGTPTISGGDLTGGNGGAGGDGGTGIGGGGGNGGEGITGGGGNVTVDPGAGNITIGGGTGGSGGTGTGGNGAGGTDAVNPGKLTSGTTSVTVNPTVTGWTYKIYDEDGVQVGEAKTGTGSSITFTGLIEGKQYTVKATSTDPGSTEYLVGSIKTTTSGGGGGGTGTTTGVTVPKRPGGGTTISPTNPKPGEEIIITINPDKGYVLDKLTVKDPKGNELTVTPMGGGKYKVTMPDPAVKLTVDATFKKLTNDPKANGVSDLLNVDDHIAYMKGRSGGTFAPADNMTRAEVAQMFYNLLKTQNTDLGSKASYNDIPANAWYAKAVNTLANIGIVNGSGGGNFSPERTITRAEFIVIAARFANATTGGDTFSDVPATHWAYKEITTATAYGWIGGYGDGSFKPGDLIARSEAVKVVNAMLSRSADKAFIDKAEGLVTFPDVPKTDWAYSEIIEATNAHDYTKKDGVESWTK